MVFKLCHAISCSTESCSEISSTLQSAESSRLYFCSRLTTHSKPASQVIGLRKIRRTGESCLQHPHRFHPLEGKGTRPPCPGQPADNSAAAFPPAESPGAVPGHAGPGTTPRCLPPGSECFFSNHADNPGISEEEPPRASGVGRQVTGASSLGEFRRSPPSAFRTARLRILSIKYKKAASRALDA